jgi:hypothetical protein
MIVQLICDHCTQYVDAKDWDICVDCGDNLCTACAVLTSHRTVHEAPADHEREERPQGWTYLRCLDTPYSIHDAEAA